MKTYEQGDAVRVEITVKLRSNRTWTLHDPGSGCKITIYDPNRTAVVSDQSMTKEAVGYYFYNWQSSVSSVRGPYTVRIVADDGSTQGTREDRLFEIK